MVLSFTKSCHTDLTTNTPLLETNALLQQVAILMYDLMFNTHSKWCYCRCLKASSYFNMHILDRVSQMGRGGITSNEKVSTGLVFPHRRSIFCAACQFSTLRLKRIYQTCREGKPIHLIISQCLQRTSPSLQTTCSLGRQKLAFAGRAFNVQSGAIFF